MTDWDWRSQLVFPCTRGQVGSEAMIVRPSQKLCTKLKIRLTVDSPLDPHPFGDWSANLFTAQRKVYMIVSNTVSLYTAVFPGRGVADERQFIQQAMEAIHQVMEHDGQSSIFENQIAPAMEQVHFGKALNRSGTGSMNDLMNRAKVWLTERNLSPFDTALRLNEMPFSSLNYRTPHERFYGFETK